MNKTIEIDGKEYEINFDKAVESGVIKEVYKKVTGFSEGDIFDFDSSYYSLFFIVRTSYNEEKYSIKGIDRKLSSFSNQQNVTKESILEYINLYECKKIGNVNEVITPYLELLCSKK